MKYFGKILPTLQICNRIWLAYLHASLWVILFWNHTLVAQEIAWPQEWAQDSAKQNFKQSRLGSDVAQDKNDKPKKKQQKQRKQRSFRYILSSDLGFLLGFNGRKFLDSARLYFLALQSPYRNGSYLRYGFSGTLNFGMSWFIGPVSNFSGSQSKSSQSAGPDKKQILFYRWKLGFGLRNMFSMGKTSVTHFNQEDSTDNFYNQQDFRVFYAFQPVITGSYMITPVWELQFFTGPSFNINIYQKSFEEFLLVRQRIIYTISESFTDSPSMDVFSLGVVAGTSLSRYFYPNFSAGISTQFVLNVSPYRGPYAWDYNLGNFVFALYLQLSL